MLLSGCLSSPGNLIINGSYFNEKESSKVAINCKTLWWKWRRKIEYIFIAETLTPFFSQAQSVHKYNLWLNSWIPTTFYFKSNIIVTSYKTCICRICVDMHKKQVFYILPTQKKQGGNCWNGTTNNWITNWLRWVVYGLPLPRYSPSTVLYRW